MALRRILVPIDFSIHARAATELGLVLAAMHGAELMLFHADHPPGSSSRDGMPMGFPMQMWRSYREGRIRTVRALIEAECNALRARHPDVPIEMAVRQIDIVRGIQGQAIDWGADLIVMGSRGADDDDRFLFGSITAKVIREGACPIMVTHDGQRELPGVAGFSRPLVAIDFSAFSSPAIRLAIELAAPSATLELLHVWRSPVSPDHETSPGLEDPDLGPTLAASTGELETRMRRLAGPIVVGAVAVTYSVERGRVAPVILDRARGRCDLIVMGSSSSKYSPTGFTGSTAHRVLHHTPVPVAVIPEGSLSFSSRQSS